MSKFWKWITELPLWVQLAFIAILLFIAWKIYKYFDNKAHEKDLQNTVDDAQQELNTSVQQNPLTHPESTYSGWANQIFGLIDGCDFWTNQTKITEIFGQINNDSDYLMLVIKFGVREIDNCGPFTGSYNADLPFAFKSESFTGLASAINVLFMKKGMKSRI